MLMSLSGLMHRSITLISLPAVYVHSRHKQLHLCKNSARQAFGRYSVCVCMCVCVRESVCV